MTKNKFESMTSRRSLLRGALVAGVLLGFVCAPRPARAATLIVVSNADSGSGTLRDAIVNSSADDTILFDEAQVVSPIVLTSGELVIDHNLTITGPTGTSLTISGNNTSRIFDIQSGTVSLSYLTISDGIDADGVDPSESIDGAGIYNGGTLSLSNSTVAGNNARYFGGGIANGGTLDISNCTISGNSAESDNGGGIENFNTLRISNSTVFGNVAGYGGGGIANDDINNATTSIDHTIVAGNDNPVYGNPDVRGTFASGGYNLIGQRDGGAGFTAIGDQTGTIATPLDPQFDPAGLSDNGGPTQTIALQASSLALNAGDPNFAGPPDFDQRGSGYPRVQGGRIDIGAFEAPAPSAPAIDNFTAKSGPAGGAPVTILGRNLKRATAVKFGGQAVPGGSFSVNRQGSIITVAVPETARSGAISVTTPAGKANKGTFTVTSPTILSFTPTSGKAGTAIKLTGTRFSSVSSVRFNSAGGGWVSTGFHYNAVAKTLTTVVPTNAVTGKIRVTSSLGTGATVTAFVVQ